MSSNHTGDPTATQAPSGTPGDGTAPIVQLPSDGDALDAASVAQMGKMPADYLAMAQAPFPATGTPYALDVMPFKDARQRKRFKLDHFALPGGSFHDWREGWTPTTPFTFSGSGGIAGNWTIDMVGAGGQAAAIPSGIAANLNFTDRHPVLDLTSDSSATGKSISARLNDDCIRDMFSIHSLWTWRWIASPNNTTNVDWVMGTVPQSAVGETISSLAHSAFFIAVSGGNWHARTINGGAPTDTDTGVTSTASTVRLFEITFAGGDIADGSTSLVSFKIDGVEVASHTTNLPMGFQAAPIFGGFTTGSSVLCRLFIGPFHAIQATQLATP